MYKPKDFKHLLGTPGFSDDLLTNHFALYEGYVANVNKIENILEKTESGSVEYAELQRRFGWEWNGMRLHELYFGNMTNPSTGSGQEMDEGLKEKITEKYGSVERWREDFVATGAMRGIGWVIFAQDSSDGKLFTVWIDEHSTGHLAGATPLLVMDVFEHAFILDYGLKRAEYIEAFMKAIDWKAVEERLT